MPQVKISFIVPCYNEAARIGAVLEHATRWADEVVIMDKGSTDGTLDMCRKAGEKVCIRPVPYSEQAGHENITDLPGLVQNDWVFLSTCSEIPTKKLIAACRQILDQREAELDMVYVPRRMYLFGLNCSNPASGVCHYPYLFHRRRAQVTGEIHNSIHATDPSRTFRIPYAEDCCVYHLAHPIVRSYWLNAMHYFEAETRRIESPDKSIRQSFKNIERISQKVLQDGENWLPFYCAQVSYELGKVLHIWEKARGKDQGALIYKNLRAHLLASEWTGVADHPALPAPPNSLSVPDAKPVAATLGRLPYFLIKCAMLLQRLQPWRH
ncbi:MAG: glycosyltransferase [Methylacidiphilales bacterium]|nr:glycosyltransferase [Candidatus Methylacidiphilales bacterium]